MIIGLEKKILSFWEWLFYTGYTVHQSTQDISAYPISQEQRLSKPSLLAYIKFNNWAVTCDFQQCGILTSVHSDEPVQPHFKLRNSKWSSVSSLTLIEYSSNYQRLWSDCAYAGHTYHIVGNLMSQLICRWRLRPNIRALAPLGKATPNKFLDSHPNFEKSWGGWELLIFLIFF